MPLAPAESPGYDYIGAKYVTKNKMSTNTYTTTNVIDELLRQLEDERLRAICLAPLDEPNCYEFVTRTTKREVSAVLNEPVGDIAGLVKTAQEKYIGVRVRFLACRDQYYELRLDNGFWIKTLRT